MMKQNSKVPILVYVPSLLLAMVFYIVFLRSRMVGLTAALYLLFLPLAGKLKRLSAQELLVKQLIINGILSIQAGDNPRILEQKLHAFVSPHERKSVFK